MPTESTETTALVGSDEASDVKVYARRWYILAVFSILGILQGMIWNSFGPISRSVLAVFCPDWTTSTLALLGNWGNIMYIAPIVPIVWFFQVKGLRASMILTAGLMILGTGLRCLPVDVDVFTWLCHVCAISNGVAGIVIGSAPSALSAAWFPPDERTTATGIAIVFNNLGNALSFLAGPAIVPDPSNFSQHLINGSINDEKACPEVFHEEAESIRKRIKILMYSEAGLVAACFLAILVYFPSKPKKPPSLSSSQERENFMQGLKDILCNRDALLMALCFSLFNGLIASWYSVMNITFSALPIGNPDVMDRTIGYIGLWAILGNSVGAVLVSRVVDSLQGRMKATLVVLMTAAVACWLWLGLICLRVIPFSILQLYISTILASALTYSTGPIFFELTVELVYPVPEMIVGGFLTCIYNGVGMIFLFLFYVPSIAANPHWIPIAFMTSTCASLPLLLLVRERYNRSVVDNFQEPSTTLRDHRSYEAI